LSLRLLAGGRRPLALAVALGAAALALPASASAATCAFNASTATVTVTVADNDDAVVGRSLAGNIQVDGANCSTATVTNTDKIQVDGPGTTTTPGDTDVTVSVANGPLGPGKTAETGTGVVSEIEIALQLGNGYDYFRLVGGALDDRFTYGMLGVNLNTDADNDLVFSGVDSTLEVAGKGGNDTISGAGGAGTGNPTNKRLMVLGGAGNDTLTGGVNTDDVYADADESFGAPVAAGNDTLRGGSGNDDLFGQTGDDVVDGDSGVDRLYFDAGVDTYRGGAGNDSFLEDFSSTTFGLPDGADGIDGGSGGDVLWLDHRTGDVRVQLDNLPNDGNISPAEGDNVKNMEDFHLGSGNDVVDVDEAGPNTVEASNYVGTGAGNDTILAGAGDDSVDGYDGNDTIFGHAGDDDLDGLDDNDTIRGGDGDDDITAGLGADTSYGDAGSDQLWQESSADGADLISGGADIDELYFYGRTTHTRISLDNSADPDGAGPLKGNDGADVDANGIAEEGDQVDATNENIFTGTGNDRIDANFAVPNSVGLANHFDGGLGNDVLLGGAGDDQLFGDAGNDDLTGHAGHDDMYGEGGADIFRSLDGYFDYLHGGFDSGAIDTVPSSDAFDEKYVIPN
jgi:Ca2+-binding RTX toxin-like protein